MKKAGPNRLLSPSSTYSTIAPWLRSWINCSFSPWIVGGLVISVVVLITYRPAFNIGFWYDDFLLFEKAARPSWPEFWASIFGSEAQRFFAYYRPIQQIQWRIEYIFLGADPLGYHFVQILLHLLNCVLLYGLIGRLSENWRVGFVGALLYAVLPAYSLSVLYLGVADPLAILFYLLAICLWIVYLEKGGWLRFGFTFAAYVLAVFTKEIALTLPITLLLVDRWLIAKPARTEQWVLRIAPFFFLLPFWALSEQGVLVDKMRAGFFSTNSSSLLSNVVFYLSALTFPWGIGSLVPYLTFLVVIPVFIYALITRKFRFLFIGVVGAVSVSIVPFSSPLGTASRYLYLPIMLSAAGIGLLVEGVWTLIPKCFPNRGFTSLVAAALALVIVLVTMQESITTAESAENFSGVARQTRLQFRPIYQQHPGFGPDTLLYFIEPPFSSYDVSGLMYLH